MFKKEIEGGAHHVDVHVGRKLRELRRKNGVSQDLLAQSVGLTFQQVQKYEKGLNRISCSKLHDFAKFLKTDIKYFFEGLDSILYPDPGHSSNYALADSGSHEFEIPASQAEVSELIRAFSSIKDPKARGHILAIIKALAL